MKEMDVGSSFEYVPTVAIQRHHLETSERGPTVSSDAASQDMTQDTKRQMQNIIFTTYAIRRNTNFVSQRI